MQKPEEPADSAKLQVSKEEKPEEPADSAKPQVSEKEAALHAAMGSPVVAVLAPKDAQPQQSELSASSSSSDKCGLRDIMDQETEVCVTPSCLLSTLAANAPSILITIMVMATASAL